MNVIIKVMNIIKQRATQLLYSTSHRSLGTGWSIPTPGVGGWGGAQVRGEGGGV